LPRADRPAPVTSAPSDSDRPRRAKSRGVGRRLSAPAGRSIEDVTVVIATRNYPIQFVAERRKNSARKRARKPIDGRGREGMKRTKGWFDVSGINSPATGSSSNYFAFGRYHDFEGLYRGSRGADGGTPRHRHGISSVRSVRGKSSSFPSNLFGGMEGGERGKTRGGGRGRRTICRSNLSAARNHTAGAGSTLSGLRRSRFEAMETLNNPARDSPERDGTTRRGRKHAVGLPNRECGSSKEPPL